MHNIFISHSPYLLKEFPLDNNVMLKFEGITAERTVLLTEGLRSFGIVVRINLTLWFVSTESTVSEVYQKILSLFKSTSEDRADIFIIDASTFSGDVSQDTFNRMQAICEMCSTSSSQSPPVTHVTSSKSKKADRQSRREQIAEEYGIKPTDAMFQRLSGSFEGGKR